MISLYSSSPEVHSVDVTWGGAFYHIVCIHSISAPAITQTTNEAPVGPESVWITVAQLFDPLLHSFMAPNLNCRKDGAIVQFIMLLHIT